MAKWELQLGSLGSGNHFIEVCADETDAVWLFLHSGSRGVGNKIAQHHIGVAQRCSGAEADPRCRTRTWRTWRRAPPEFDRYIEELRWAQHFALLNREEMMDRVDHAVRHTGWAARCTEAERINCHHNFTAQETHYGKSVWVSRKGAIKAEARRPGLDPGLHGHGLLRRGGHGQPGVAEFLAARRRPGILPDRGPQDLHPGRAEGRPCTGIEFRATEAFIDEIPAAYKPIDQVMRDAADLVKIRHTLRQLVNVKGD